MLVLLRVFLLGNRLGFRLDLFPRDLKLSLLDCLLEVLLIGALGGIARQGDSVNVQPIYHPWLNYCFVLGLL